MPKCPALSTGRMQLYVLVIILSLGVLRILGRVPIVHLCVPSAEDDACLIAGTMSYGSFVSRMEKKGRNFIYGKTGLHV